MPYFEEIKEAYESVCNGETSEASVQKALQYENWLNLHDEITTKILNHKDYLCVDSHSKNEPIPYDSKLPQDCQVSRSNIKISLAYSLDRVRNTDRLNMIDFDDLPQLWEMFERGRKRKRGGWITTNRLTLRSEQDLYNLVCRLGLYHWLPLNTPVFCLEWHNLSCVKPNALDARLAFYFHQTPGQTPGRTRNLETGKPDMEEWLCLKVDKEPIKCVGGCLTHQKLELNVSDYYKNNAQRIRGSKTVWKNSK